MHDNRPPTIRAFIAPPQAFVHVPYYANDGSLSSFPTHTGMNDMKLWSILGNSQKLDGGAMFGNAPRALWERWTTVDDANRIDLACRALLASPLAGKTVLFEAGIGAFFAPALRERYGVVEPNHVLLDSLAEAG